MSMIKKRNATFIDGESKSPEICSMAPLVFSGPTTKSGNNTAHQSGSMEVDFNQSFPTAEADALGQEATGYTESGPTPQQTTTSNKVPTTRMGFQKVTISPIIQKHHALDMLHIIKTYYYVYKMIISIPELFTAHKENCKHIPEGFNRDVAMSPVNTWNERHGVHTRKERHGAQGTNSTRCKTKMHLHSTQISIHL